MKMHRTTAALFKTFNMNKLEKFRPEACPSQSNWLVESIIFNNLYLLGRDQSMYALSIGSPRVMRIALLRVKSRALKYFPWQRAEIDVDMGKVNWIAL